MRLAKDRRAFAPLIPIISALASAGTLVPVLIILGIALAVLLFGPPTFLSLLIGFFTSPMKTIGILLLILAAAWLLITRNFTVAAIIGAVGLLLLLGAQFGLLGIVEGAARAQGTLVGDAYYVHPKDGGYLEGFSEYASRGCDADKIIELSDTGCTTPDDGRVWTWTGYCEVAGRKVSARCSGNDLVCTVPTDILTMGGRWCDAWEGGFTTYARWTAPPVPQVATPTGQVTEQVTEQALGFWQRFLTWLREVFA